MKEKTILDERVPVTCDCKRQKRTEMERVRYGVNSCDTFSFCHTVGIILANALFQFIHDTGVAITGDSFDRIGGLETVKKHAIAIREYALTDEWDNHSQDKGVKLAYRNKEKDFREAMKWLTKYWQYLWW